MKYRPTKTRHFALALFWLVATTLWAPVGVLAHVAGGDHSSSEQLIQQYTRIASGDYCQMDDCAESVEKLSDCEFACQYFIDSARVDTHSIRTIDTFSFPLNSFIKHPSLALLERPPKYFV